MTNDHHQDERPPWLEQVRVAAEITVAVGAVVITVLDVLERSGQLPQRPPPPSQLPVLHSGEEEEE